MALTPWQVQQEEKLARLSEKQAKKKTKKKAKKKAGASTTE